MDETLDTLGEAIPRRWLPRGRPAIAIAYGELTFTPRPRTW